MMNTVHKLSIKTLKKNRVELPLALELFHDHSAFYGDAILRVLPGKRVVLSGTFQNKPVVAKLFYSWRARKQAERDIAGTKILEHAAIPTPTCLYYGKDGSQKIQVIIFEKIMNAESLEQLFHKKTSWEEITPLLHALTLELATQHVMGVLQKDLHFKNFLVQNNKIITLDGGSIQHFPTPLSKKQSLDNLALFFAQFGVCDDALLQQLYVTYHQSRGWVIADEDYPNFKKSVAQKLRWRAESFKKKILRNSTTFRRISTLNRTTLYDSEYASDAFLAFLKNPKNAFSSTTKVLKAGGSSTVIQLNIDNKSLIVKRYNIKGFFHGLRRLLRPTRAWHSWLFANELRLMGIATARPVAMIEQRYLKLFRGTSYFVMEAIPGIDSGHYFSKMPPQSAEMAKKILRLLDDLKTLCITHGDLKLTNILIDGEKPYLIDLDGMQQHRSQRSLKCAYEKEYQRLMKNWQDNPAVKKLFTA